MPHNHFSEAKVSLTNCIFYHPSFGKDSDNEVAIELLTTVVDAQVDVALCYTMIQKYPNS